MLRLLVCHISILQSIVLIDHEQSASCLLFHSKDYLTMAANKWLFIRESSSEILFASRSISKVSFVAKEAEANRRIIFSVVEATLAIILLVRKCEYVTLYHRPFCLCYQS